MMWDCLALFTALPLQSRGVCFRSLVAKRAVDTFLVDALLSCDIFSFTQTQKIIQVEREAHVQATVRLGKTSARPIAEAAWSR